MDDNMNNYTHQGSKLSDDIHKTLDQFGKKYCKDSNDQLTVTMGSDQKCNEVNTTAVDDDPLHAGLLNSDSHCDDDNTSDGGSLTSDSSQSSSERLNLEKEWQTLFGANDYYDHLRQHALDGKLRYSKFRSVCWKIFLDCLPEEKDIWMESTQMLRQNYSSLKEQFLVDPNQYQDGTADLQVNNPLSQEDHSPWKQYFENSELKTAIKQDLDRLVPEIEYFQRTRVKEIMMHILFCYAKRFGDLGYKQGMHELLAPIVYVLDSEAKIYKYLEGSNLEVAKYIMDPLHIESDAFALFCQLMELTGQWFQHTQVEEVKVKLLDPHASLFSDEQETSPPSAIVKKLNRIHDHMLKKFDSDLWKHLKRLEIAPQLYGMRWIRLLFGREFRFSDVLLLWDALFADGASLVLVDYVFVAMLTSIREKLLRGNYSTCLGYLMKFPRVSDDPRYFVKRALALKGKKSTRSKSTRLRPSAPLPTSVKTVFSTLPKKHANSAQKQHTVFSNLTKRLPSAHVARTENTKPLVYHKTLTEVEDHPLNRASGQSKPARPASVPTVVQDPSRERTDSFGTRAVGRAMKVIGLGKRQGAARLDIEELEQDHERLQHQVSELKTELDKTQGLFLYCGRKMDSYIGLLQEELQKDGENNKEILYLSLAGLKQVRDLLKGTLSFRGSTLEHECDFMEIDNNIAARLQVSSPNQQPENLPENISVPLLANYGHFEHAEEKESSFTESYKDDISETHIKFEQSANETLDNINKEKKSINGETDSCGFDDGSSSVEILKSIQSSLGILASTDEIATDLNTRFSQETVLEDNQLTPEENLDSFVFVNRDGTAAHAQSTSAGFPLENDDDHFQEF